MEFILDSSIQDDKDRFARNDKYLMEIVNPKIERYLYELHPTTDPVLKEMEQLAQQRDFPIVGPMVGQILYQLALMIGAKRIFEMGSGFGYSTWWFARALPPTGEIFHTDFEQAHSNQARTFLQKAKLDQKVRFLVGDALQHFDQTKGELDIVFIDMNKQDYPTGYRKAKPRLRHGGLLIADNTLWFGHVLDKKSDEATRGIQEFNQLTSQDEDFVHTILPVRDGIAVCLKK